MIISKSLRAILTLGAVLAVYVTQVNAESRLPDHFNTLSENLVTGGQPSSMELVQLKEAGVTKIINLRGPDEKLPFDEEAQAKSLGFEYISLPITGAADITSDNAKKLHDLLEGKEKVFLHCASANRVGALMAIRAHSIEGKPVQESLNVGRSAGLGSLEEKVKSILNEAN